MRLLCTLVAALALLTSAVSASEKMPPLTNTEFDAIWSETQFDRIAVEQHGIKKSLASFARDQLDVITPRRFRKSDDNVTLLLTLVARPGALAEMRLPIEGDALIPILAEAGVEVDQRTVGLNDCLVFGSMGEIIGEGPAMRACFGVLAQHDSQGQHDHAVDADKNEGASRLLTRISRLIELRENFRLFPHPVDIHGPWDNFSESAARGEADPQVDELRLDMARLMMALSVDQPSDARTAATSLSEGLPTLANYPTPTHMKVDYLYTTKRPYFWASFSYVVAAMLFLISLLGKRDRWWWAAMVVLSAGLTMHTLGAVARGILIQRVPLSNLYEATTTGLAFVILVALILEACYRMKVVGMMSALMTFLYYRWLLSSAQFGGDQIDPLRAVLNSYWLDYHVTCMILSYGAFTVAFGMAVLYLAKVHLPRLMKWAPSGAELDLYNHRAIQIGWPILAIGVVLGAIWADTAWGRMWSWDPKETWALITWLVYTVYMHMRFVGGFSGRIMAWASVGGYGCVLFTYLGVNTVLTGLHSYASNADDAGKMTSPLALVLWCVLGVVLLIITAVIASLAMKKRTKHVEID